MNKRNRFLTCIGVVVLMVTLQTTLFGGYFLPASDIWQGSRNVNISSGTAYVEYAVYDATDLPDEIDITTTDKYVYAYQIFNDQPGDYDLPIASMILSGGNTSVAHNIGSLTDGTTSGVSPDYSAINTTDSTFVWEFQNGLLVEYAHSMFLVFTSDYAPKAGTIALSTEYGDDIPVNGDGTTTGDSSASAPEPTTIALLSIGAFGLLRKKVKRS
ncbi:MAG: PEP-CTERM sorting domain-containing protein [Planctomycetaceae bacterium]|nr:PEP-CTERM sorting domain-containing protein [Planctomycetaceae bacterium]